MNNSNYFNQILKAIEYLTANYKSQPNLDNVAEMVQLSPFQFQQLFTEWAGVSPEKFVQYLSINYAKSLLLNKKRAATLFDTASNTEFYGTKRLRNQFIHIEEMTPSEYINDGENLAINYNFEQTPFGKIIIASTSKGICHLEFIEDETLVVETLQCTYPKAIYTQSTDEFQQTALLIFNNGWNELNDIKLHLKGTDFQLKVWNALLTIQMGQLTSYGNLAKLVDNPKASRAVGSAIGENPVAFLIPCHRVIQSTGLIGQYHWRSCRKAAIIGWEAAQCNN